LVVPVICAATIAYFGYFTVWGERGLIALASAQGELHAEQQQLASLKDDREHLQYRLELLREHNPDMFEELRRNKMLNALPGEVVIQRH
jgi:cell division protein FtsB